MKCVLLLVLVILIQFLLPRHDDEQESDVVTSIPTFHGNNVEISLRDIGLNLIASWMSLRSTLQSLIGCESLKLSSVSGGLHEILSTISPSLNTVSTLSYTLSDVFSVITQVALNLDIGTGAVEAIEKIKTDLTDVLKIVNEGEFDVNNLNNAVMLALSSVAVVFNTVAVVAEASAVKLGLISTETQEALLSLTLVLHSTLVIAQSVFNSVAYVISSSASKDSSTLNLALLTIDRVLQGVANATTLITSSITQNMSLVIGSLSVTLTPLAVKLNESLEKIEARNVLEITNHLQVVVNKLSDVIGNLTTSITRSVQAITISLTSVASSGSSLQAKVATQLYPVYKTILQFNGTDHELVTQLTNTLSSIFDIITSSTNRLMYGISIELIAAVVLSIKNIQTPLSELLSLISNENFEKLKVNEEQVNSVVKELAKSVQIFGSIADAISSTIYKSVTSFNAIVLEANMALQFIHATVIYVVNWVNALGASIFLSTVGSANDSLSKLSVFMLVILQFFAKITGIISNSLLQSPFKTVFSIMPHLINLGEKVISAMSAVSLVNTNTKFTIEQLSPKAVGVVPISIENNTTTGSVSQILNGLTGSLGSISSTLSSSLSSITNSLNRIVSSDSETLKSIGSDLILVVTKISEITGSASEIINVTSSSLISVFGQLLVMISKLTLLSEISISLSSCTSQLSTAVYSLIDAICDCNGSFYIIYEPVQNVAKNVQILISTFAAIITAAADAGNEIRNTVADTILAITYVVSTIILVVHHGLSAMITSLAVTFERIPIFLEKFTLSMTAIMESITSIATKAAMLKIEFNNMKSSVSDLNNMTSSSLSTISGVVANLQVPLNVKV